MILNAIEGKELPVYGDGLQQRDWLHVHDHCEALQAVLERGVVGETYCIGGGDQRVNLDVVMLICDLVDARLSRPARTSRRLIRHVTDRPAHDRRYAIDATKTRRELDWRPRRALEAALPSVVDWYVANTSWVDAIRTGEYLRYYQQQYGQRLPGTS
jgi:dTDP-glucose 4,6-dehydratase